MKIRYFITQWISDIIPHYACFFISISIRYSICKMVYCSEFRSQLNCIYGEAQSYLIEGDGKISKPYFLPLDSLFIIHKENTPSTHILVMGE